MLTFPYTAPTNIIRVLPNSVLTCEGRVPLTLKTTTTQTKKGQTDGEKWKHPFERNKPQTGLFEKKKRKQILDFYAQFIAFV